MHDLTAKQSILTLYLLTHKIQLPCKRRILQIRKLLYVFSVCYSSFSFLLKVHRNVGLYLRFLTVRRSMQLHCVDLQ